MNEQSFKFALRDLVKLNMSGEFGEVIGRASYTYSEPAYLLRYVAADGRQVEAWQTEGSLVSFEPKHGASAA